MTLDGATFENVVVGAADSLTGDGSDNMLQGLGGNDTLTRGAGDDTYVFDSDKALGTNTLIESGGGIDLLDFGQSATAIVVDLSLSGVQVVNANLSLILGSGTASSGLSAVPSGQDHRQRLG